MKHYIEQLATGFEWKMVFSVLGTLIATLDGFYGQLVWGFLGLFLLDLMSGILKSLKNGVTITSKRLRGSVTKLAAYMVLITALIIASKVEASFVPIVTVTYYYFIFTELKSILENIEEMGVKLPPILKSKVMEKLDMIDTNQTIAEQKIDEVQGKMEVVEDKVVKIDQVQEHMQEVQVKMEEVQDKVVKLDTVEEHIHEVHDKVEAVQAKVEKVVTKIEK